MSRRRTDALYAGAAGVVRLEDIAALGAGWAVQPKVDGAYVTILTDGGGAITNMVFRSGRMVSPAVLAEFAAVRHVPSSVLIGELEIWTERAARAVQTRGYRLAWLHDAQRVQGQSVTRLGYAARRDALRRAEALLARPPAPFVIDASGRAHDRADGTFTTPIPTAGIDRLPIVDQRPARRAEQAWADWGVASGEAEGLVAVRLDAPLAARRAKLKAKPQITIDCRVVEVAKCGAVLDWRGHRFVVACTSKLNREGQLQPGALVEVLCDGFGEGAGVRPTHPRITRLRHDLMPAGAAVAS